MRVPGLPSRTFPRSGPQFFCQNDPNLGECRYLRLSLAPSKVLGLGRITCQIVLTKTLRGHSEKKFERKDREIEK